MHSRAHALSAKERRDPGRPAPGSGADPAAQISCDCAPRVLRPCFASSFASGLLPFLLIAGLAASLSAFSSPLLAEVRLTDLQADLQRLEAEVARAEADLALSPGGAAQALIVLRLETVRLTRALIDQRLTALQTGTTIESALPALQPNEAAALEVAQQLVEARAALQDARVKTEMSGGLMATLAAVEEQTRAVTVAQLELALAQALYGLALPEIDLPAPETSDTPASDQALAVPNGEAAENEPVSLPPAWADPDHPEIDYDHPAFRSFHETGYRFSGWWAIEEGRAQIDDSPSVTAVNVIDHVGQRPGYRASDPAALSVRCREGEAAVFYTTAAVRLAGC